VAAHVPAGPYALAAEAGVGLGFFFATHGRVGLSVGRRFVRYLDLHAAFTLDAGEHLLGFEEAVGAGLVLPLKERWELTFGWRMGVVSFRGDLPAGVLWTTALMVSVVVEARYLLTRRWELRFAPVTGTGFWNKIWGFVLSPTLGAAVRF
jgi:hypothetical protein